MVLAIFLVVLGVMGFAIGGTITISAYDGAEAFGGFVLVIIGVAIFLGGMALGNELNHSNDETGKICAEKHGLVNDDGYCIVKGAPVEYSKGVWTK